MKDPGDLMMVAAMAGIGWIAGVMFAPSIGWSLIGLALGGAVGRLMARAAVRRAVGPVITAGGIVGAWIGREIIRALCLPGSCVRVEVAGATLAGIGSLLGIGLVVALAVRSFEEFEEKKY